MSDMHGRTGSISEKRKKQSSMNTFKVVFIFVSLSLFNKRDQISDPIYY